MSIIYDLKDICYSYVFPTKTLFKMHFILLENIKSVAQETTSDLKASSSIVFIQYYVLVSLFLHEISGNSGPLMNSNLSLHNGLPKKR